MCKDRLTMQDPRRQYDGPPFPRQPQSQPGLAKRMTPRPDHGEESYFGSGRLLGRKALITGGDSGLGRAGAIAFARKGADVAFGYLPSEEEDAREVVELVEAEGRRALPLPGDIGTKAFCTESIRRAAAGLGGLDILVNNAGHQESRSNLAEVSSEEFDRALEIKLYALLWITRCAVPLLPPGASVINTASIQAFEPSEAILAYATSKAGIVAFTKALAKQLIGEGVRVDAVATGPFWTPLQPGGGQAPSKVENFGSQVPMGRPGQPVEITPVYVSLASQEASYVTGEVYSVNGGIDVVEDINIDDRTVPYPIEQISLMRDLESSRLQDDCITTTYKPLPVICGVNNSYGKPTDQMDLRVLRPEVCNGMCPGRVVPP